MYYIKRRVYQSIIIKFEKAIILRMEELKHSKKCGNIAHKVSRAWCQIVMQNLPVGKQRILTTYKEQRNFLNNTSSFILSWKVDGSMFGNSFRATGSKNSMNGTIMKTATGTNLKMSAVVRVSCCRSLLERPFPLASLTSSLTLILTSAQSNFVPSQ